MSLLLPPTGLAAIVATPATFGAVETVVDKAKIPANTFQIGTTLHIVSLGTVSAAAAGTVLGRMRIGTAGTTADTQICATAATGAAVAAIGWKLEGYVTIRTLGSGGTCLGNAQIEDGTNLSNITSQTATAAVNTTVDNFLSITIIGGGTTPVVTVVQTLINVVKP